MAGQSVRTTPAGHRTPVRRDIPCRGNRDRDAEPGTATRIKGRARAPVFVGSEPDARPPRSPRAPAREGRVVLCDAVVVGGAADRLARLVPSLESVPFACERRR